MSETAIPSRWNIEIKARVKDLARLRELAVAAGALPHTIEKQTDTYFAVPHGRMKLREREGEPAYLICYRRPDQQASKASHYYLLDIAEPALFVTMMSAVMDVRTVVRKVREVLLWKNVRIHLDRVDGLGEFLELEAVLRLQDSLEDGEVQVAHLMPTLGIEAQNLIADSYVDLLEAKHSQHSLPETGRS